MGSFLRRFLRDDEASIAVETLVVLPALLWAYLGTWVFFDAFRDRAINVKVGYTINDALSRETEVTPEYMDSLFALQRVLTATAEPVWLRVTLFRWNGAQSRYEVVWSQTRGGGQPLTTALLAQLAPRLPNMQPGESSILTETWVDYVPVTDVGLDPFTFHEFVVTRPRFATTLCFNTVNDNGGPATATC
jgi:hypothetical protein